MNNLQTADVVINIEGKAVTSRWGYKNSEDLTVARLLLSELELVREQVIRDIQEHTLTGTVKKQ